MSTYCLRANLRKRASYSALAFWGGLLLVLQLTLPSIVFASPAQPVFDLGKNKAFDLASVAVVRLVVNYGTSTSAAMSIGLNPHATPTPTPPADPCTQPVTGLGVLVGSWQTSTANSRDITNWVLTASNILNPDGMGCMPGNQIGNLTKIQVLANTAFTGNSSTNNVLKSLNCNGTPHAVCVDNAQGLPVTILCNGPTTCNNDVVLLSFHTTAPLPFVKTAFAGGQSTSPFSLTFTGSTEAQNVPPVQQLTPQQSSDDPTTSGSEPGTPFFSNDGTLITINVPSTADTPESIDTFITTKVGNADGAKGNILQTSWSNGLNDYYSTPPRYSNAAREFQSAFTANNQFAAASVYQHMALQKGGIKPVPTPGPNTTPATGTSSIQIMGVHIPLLILIGAVFVLLILVLILLSIIILRRRKKQRELEDFELERKAAEQKAAIEAQRIAEMERQNAAQQLPSSAAANQRTKISEAKTITEWKCPQCQSTVSFGDNFCPNCRMALSPSASGLHLKVTPPAQSAPPSSLPTYAQTPAPAGLVPSAAMSEQPTLEMEHDVPTQPRNGRSDTDATIPFATTPKQMPNQNVLINLKTAVRSDPGIKRKHRPNEDSVLAVTGERLHNSQAQQFGLFVVADGMGGHANGQDASRLAIQTIVDKIFPRLSSSQALSEQELLQLLVDGVQSANLAVHDQNIETRADMGTTMTAALVIGATAYVANVGDSRTYLYRENEGLKKITHDHSVVASLVEAGIIKPDDIYTHPKRNQIYRSLGEKPAVEIDSFAVPLRIGDKLLLCSDGLWDMVRDPEIERIMCMPVPEPMFTGNALIRAALDGGGEDNVSVIVVQIAEANRHTGMTGVQTLVKPDKVQMPGL